MKAEMTIFLTFWLFSCLFPFKDVKTTVLVLRIRIPNGATPATQGDRDGKCREDGIASNDPKRWGLDGFAIDGFAFFFGMV